MSDLFLKFIYSNAARGILKVLGAVALYALPKAVSLDPAMVTTLNAGALALLIAGLADLGVTGARAVTDTPRNSPDSKGDTKF